MKKFPKKYSAIFFTILVLASAVGFFGAPNKVEAAYDPAHPPTNSNFLRCVQGNGGTPLSPEYCANQWPDRPGTVPKPVAIPTNPAYKDCLALGQDDATTCALHNPDVRATPTNGGTCGWFSWSCDVSAFIGGILLRISGLVLALISLIFDGILNYTIVEMATHLGSGSGNLGDAINNAWGTLRDLANIVFIFVLLWAAIQTILELNTQNFGKTIKNIIIIALLINFSLFFTKVVIDASNIAAIGFYNSIMVSSTNAGPTVLELSKNQKVSITLSGVFMKALGLQSWYGKNALDKVGDPLNIIVIGIMGAITMLVLSVVLLVACVLFISRFIMLIFILILSPLAFIGYTIPAMKKYWDKWWGALVDQAFFAPLFFLLLWVAVKLMYSPGFINFGTEFSAVASNPQSTVSLFLNFVLVIGFIVGALIFSKQMASKTDGFKSISGGVGAVAVGGSAWLGRKTVGTAGKFAATSNKLQEAANSKTTGFRASLGRGIARAGLYAAETAQDATFDARNAKVPTSVVGDFIQGTVGRTTIGKKIGLNDVQIPNIEVGSKLIGNDLGKAGTKGQKELSAESSKRVREREAAESEALALSRAKKAIQEGATADATTAAGKILIDNMEKALAKMSDKETEALVASNRELLRSQNFANAISVKQLEAINKSDQFSESERGNLKNGRFSQIKTIHDATAMADYKTAKGIPTALHTAANKAAIKTMEDAQARVKDLSDSEIEMLAPEYFDPKTPQGREFIATLKGSQVENIISNKSGKYTSTIRENVKTERIRPLTEALKTPYGTRSYAEKDAIKKAIKGADGKTLVNYLKTDAFPGGQKIGLDPDVLDLYTVETLTRMLKQDSMNDGDISTLGAALRAGLPTAHPTAIWLGKPKGLERFPP